MDNRDTPPKISAIVCTWNNAHTLGHTLESLARQEMPHGVSYEVIVVDNNSTDNTADVAGKFISKDGTKFRYVVETRQGLSFARNRGTEEAKGEFVAFIDDDAIADPDWLARLLATYDREPQAACVGGKVALRMPEGPLPAWYSKRLDDFLSARDMPYGPAKSARDFPHGVNISFRKSAVAEAGMFHPLLGRGSPCGKVKLGGEETELCLRTMKCGWLVMFQPAARVLHLVDARRLRQEYFRELAFSSGYLEVIMENDGKLGVSTWAQFDKYARRYYRRSREYRRERATMPEPDRFVAELTLRMTWSAIWYCLWAKRGLKRRELSLLSSTRERGCATNERD